MPQIGDIAPGAEPVDHASGLLLNLGYRREKLYRIVIALQCNAISRHFPGIFRTHGPVQAKGVCPAFECHSFECVPRSFCKENDGYIFLDGRYNFNNCRKRPFVEIFRTESAGPGVKYLDRLRTGFNLCMKVLNGCICKFTKQMACCLRVLIEKGFCLVEGFGSLSLYHIAKDGPWSPGKSD